MIRTHCTDHRGDRCELHIAPEYAYGYSREPFERCIKVYITLPDGDTYKRWLPVFEGWWI